MTCRSERGWGSRLYRLGLCAALLGFAAGPEAAAGQALAVNVGLVQGDARLEREGRIQAASKGVALVPGDRLTTPRGRIELQRADGVLLHLERGTTLELTPPPGDYWLTSGRIMVSLADAYPGAMPVGVVVSSPYGVVPFVGRGRFSVAVSGRDMELSVWDGMGELVAEGGAILVRSGQRAFVGISGRPSDPLTFDRRPGDLERWATARAQPRVPVPWYDDGVWGPAWTVWTGPGRVVSRPGRAASHRIHAPSGTGADLFLAGDAYATEHRPWRGRSARVPEPRPEPVTRPPVTRDAPIERATPGRRRPAARGLPDRSIGASRP